MDLIALRYFMEDRIKPVYHLMEDDKILLTAKISRDRSRDVKVKYVVTNGKQKAVEVNREHGLYFLGVILKTKAEWSYTYTGYHETSREWYELEFEQHLKYDKRIERGVISNTLMYKKVNQKGMKDMVVLYDK